MRYLYLKKNEIIREGDEAYTKSPAWGWMFFPGMVGEEVGDEVYRRPIKTPDSCDGCPALDCSCEEDSHRRGSMFCDSALWSHYTRN